MKKQAVMMLSAALLLFACSDFSRYTTADADAPVKTRLRACMLSGGQFPVSERYVVDKNIE